MKFPQLLLCLCLGLLSPGYLGPVVGEDASTLRLIPFPKEARLEPGSFALNRRLLLEISQAEAEVLGQQICAEFTSAGLAAPSLRRLKTAHHVVWLSSKSRLTVKKLPLRDPAVPEEYALQVQPGAVILRGASQAGLFRGVQTLRQLIRANRQNDALPGVTIRDWPALSWRAFQDDLTRGPSSTAANLQAQAALGAYLKLNIFTYYMEHQFAFRKHPQIGPEGGSLTPEELKGLVDFAQGQQVDILGNQQSFGHFAEILKHPKYAPLRETPNLLSPTNPDSYRLLDDLYSEVAPLLPFPFFNVCCDETEGLGEGPSKPVADRIGVGGLYVQHIREVHELVTRKYQKRMMMWGDIILRHPTELHQIPKDTILLTWGYDARASFDDQIAPFARAGYDFVVCPGVNNWNRILPDFGVATTNIQNFVRDGVRQGAKGMLATAWDDDGESFNAPNWHGFAWGAECAWNGGTACAGAFNRRIGGVLFGERGDSFGQAIEALSTPGVVGVPSGAFWQFTFGPLKVRSVESARARWQTAIAAAHDARLKLEACQKDARVNGDLLDFFVFGAERIELLNQRELDRLEAALAYRQARRSPLTEGLALLEEIQATLQKNRDTHEGLKQRFSQLWRRENKPYALDRVLNRYRELIGTYDAQIQRLSRIRMAAKPDRSLPTPREAGFELIEEAR